MWGFFSCPLRALQLANQLLVAGALLLLCGLVGAYGMSAQLSIGSQVAAHSLTIIGPALLKLGYVVRLAAQQQLHGHKEPCCVAA